MIESRLAAAEDAATRRQAAHRRRRLIYNDDGNIDNYNYDHDNAGATRPIGGAGD